MALGDKVEGLQRRAAVLLERADHALKSLDALSASQRDILHELADLRREHAEVRREQEKEIVLLKREIEDFKKWKDDQKKEREELSRRLWAFGPSAAGALLSGLIAAAVAYFIARREARPGAFALARRQIDTAGQQFPWLMGFVELLPEGHFRRE